MNSLSTWYLCYQLEQNNLTDKGKDELIRRIKFAWDKLDFDWEADFLDIPERKK